MEFTCRIQSDGGLEFGDRMAAVFRQFRAENAGMMLRITPVFPESSKQRGFFEGAVVPLVTFYQEGLSHESGDDRATVREWLKSEFNGQYVSIGGQAHKIAKSTKGREVLGPFLERVVGWLQDNYAPPSEALDPSGYKVWSDTIFPYGGPDNYIEYLESQGVLRRSGDNV